MKWRIIELQANDAYMNMAIDESVSDHVRSGFSDPTIRFYRWKPSAVSIGRFQSMEKEIRIEKCKEFGVDCVRRITGGGAVYHDSEGEITYSVIAPESVFPHGIRESYQYICQWVIDGLANVGIDAKFVPINDITVSGRKISGNAQTRKRGVLLQHGTVLHNLDIEKMFAVLNVSQAKISDKMIKSVEDRVTAVRWLGNISYTDLYSALLSGFTKGREFEFGLLSDEELEMSAILAQNIYRSNEWNFSR